MKKRRSYKKYHTAMLTTGKAFADDPDYDSFLGTPREAIIFDHYVRRYRRVVMQPVRSRLDRVKPADSDAQIRDEPWEPTRPTAAQTQNTLQEKIVCCLTQHGPMTAKQIAPASREGYTQVCFSVAAGEGIIFCQAGRQGKAKVWGLVGVD